MKGWQLAGVARVEGVWYVFEVDPWTDPVDWRRRPLYVDQEVEHES